MFQISLWVLSVFAAGLLGRFSQDIYIYFKTLILPKKSGELSVKLSAKVPDLRGGVYHGPVPDKEEIFYILNLLNGTSGIIHIDECQIKPSSGIAPLGFNCENIEAQDLEPGKTLSVKFQIISNTSDIYIANSYLPTVLRGFNRYLQELNKEYSFDARVDYNDHGSSKSVDYSFNITPSKPIARAYSERLKTFEYNNDELNEPIKEGLDLTKTINN